ncbi:MAG: hypothetical protein LDLANPLL_01257 [Turneriella sp.]|nr:hypothetical protein [Turneriella sp.]
MIQIINVQPLQTYKLKVTFTNNESKIFDMSKYLNKGVFQELKNETYFNQVKNYKKYIAWPNDQDLSCDTLYTEGKGI